MFGGHSIVEKDGLADGNVSSCAADGALEAKIEETSVDLRNRAPGADKQAVALSPHLRQSLDC